MSGSQKLLVCETMRNVTFDKYAIIGNEVPVAQWIEHRSPEPGAQVRFLSGTPSEPRLGLGSSFWFFAADRL